MYLNQELYLKCNFHIFYAMISFLLRNIWLYLNKKYIVFIEREHNAVDHKKFRFDVFVLFIEKWLRLHLKGQIVDEYMR